jgi:serine/threonine protein kinase
LIFEYCDGGTLQDRIYQEDSTQSNTSISLASYSLSQKVNWIRDILSAIHYLHAKNIVHRDLKSSNMMFKTVKELDNNQKIEVLKIIDFGSAKFVSMTTVRSSTTMKSVSGGTFRYMPPPPSSSSSTSSSSINNLGKSKGGDVWSFAVILGEIFLEMRPYNSLFNDEQVLREKEKGMKPHDLKLIEKISPSLSQLIDLCTNQDERKRPDIETILYHYWPLIQNDLIQDNFQQKVKTRVRVK